MKELKTLLTQYLSKENAEWLATVLSKETLILIDGRQGATGKTTLCKALNELGYHAEEVWRYHADKKSDSNGVSITITLNKMIK